MNNFLVLIGIILVVAVSGIQTDLSIVKSEERMMNQIEQRFDELERKMK